MTLLLIFRLGTAGPWSSSPWSSASPSLTSSSSRNAHWEPGAQSGEPHWIEKCTVLTCAQHLRCVVVSSHDTDIQWLKSSEAGSRSYISGKNIHMNGLFLFCKNNWVAWYLSLPRRHISIHFLLIFLPMIELHSQNPIKTMNENIIKVLLHFKN